MEELQEVPIAYYVTSLNASLYIPCTLLVKDVITMVSPNQKVPGIPEEAKTTDPNTDSAGNAIQVQFGLVQEVLSEDQSSSAKCPKCKTTTLQWNNVIQLYAMEGTPAGNLGQIELMNKSKQLIVCSNCGDMRLIRH